ncbi:cobalamin biosynthesis protein CobQ [Kiloniella spongiae]|uniref:Cobyric acid synthase n=1 Tax=Kiloniella spongiae TaxID=1489064 RepID=A0A0H2MK30_9PROT|nr:cobyric acid synthase [Kiloniella spongiae]KLN61107.1 cobalamin biosynthesis protein CobQ [Kiloniella spongiae]
MTVAIMFQGTGSDVGKSLLVAGIARALSNRGLKVRPFKPQNMSNNAAVTPCGGEIGRAQALQAKACRIEPSTDMNPVLLKPQTDMGSQVIVQGKIWGNTNTGNYWGRRHELMPTVLESFYRLAAEADIVLVEGAGSPAEVNLRSGDIANMGFAIAAQVPVILIGDIDRGGVIASIVGTGVLLPQEEKDLVRGVIINKFRGDLSLFKSGVSIIEEKSSFFSLGVVPYFKDARKLPDEDAVSVQSGVSSTDNVSDKKGTIRIAVPLISRISNFDDFDPLIAEKDVELTFVHPGDVIPVEANLVILPGSKATIGDLEFLRAQGWDIDLLAHVRRGGLVLGICGGYQMLGALITDPEGIEGEVASVPGLGLLPVTTVLTGNKKLKEVHGHEITSGEPITGYEMHVGVTEVDEHQTDGTLPMLSIGKREEGVQLGSGQVSGCYLHGLFVSDSYRAAFLNRIKKREVSTLSFEKEVDMTLDALAQHMEENIDLDRLLSIAGYQ